MKSNPKLHFVDQRYTGRDRPEVECYIAVKCSRFYIAIYGLDCAKFNRVDRTKAFTYLKRCHAIQGHHVDPDPLSYVDPALQTLLTCNTHK